MPDDHSEVVPLLPIPNRTVKRFSADDSADSRVKVGHRQAFIAVKKPIPKGWAFFLLMLNFEYISVLTRSTFISLETQLIYKGYKSYE